MKPNFKGQNNSGNEPRLEEKLSEFLPVMDEVLEALKGEKFADVDREIVDRFLSRLQEIELVVAKRYGLTKRETEVWRLQRGGLSYQQIAKKLFISLNTVKRHLQSVHGKQG